MVSDGWWLKDVRWWHVINESNMRFVLIHWHNPANRQTVDHRPA